MEKHSPNSLKKIKHNFINHTKGNCFMVKIMTFYFSVFFLIFDFQNKNNSTRIIKNFPNKSNFLRLLSSGEFFKLEEETQKFACFFEYFLRN